MAIVNPHDVLTAHISIFDHLDDVFDHVDGMFGPKNTFLAVMALKCARQMVNYRDVLKEMHQQWQWLGWESTPSAGALSKARSHLDVEDCREVWQAAVAKARSILPPQPTLLEGRRIVAFDATRVVSPSTAGARKLWGQPSGKNGEKHHNPQAMMVAAWELTTGIPIEIALLEYRGSERRGALAMVEALSPGNVAIFDRGYHGREFFGDFITKGIDVVARMTTGDAKAWGEVARFLAGGEDDSVVEVKLGSGIGLRKMRLIRRRFPRGAPQKGQTRDKMVIMTTLLDNSAYPTQSIIDLYAKRWDIETRFREIKISYGLEAFHSTRVEGIEQEIYAVLTWMTLSAMVDHMAQEEMERTRGVQDWMDPERWVVRRVDVFSATRRLFFAVLVDPRSSIDNLVGLARGEAEWITTGARRRKTGRSFERVTKGPWGRWK
jgi:hypothetical protein